ncbi:unnamed protein product [Sympodiomycopsis kandeliae]
MTPSGSSSKKQDASRPRKQAAKDPNTSNDAQRKPAVVTVGSSSVVAGSNSETGKETLSEKARGKQRAQDDGHTPEPKDKQGSSTVRSKAQSKMTSDKTPSGPFLNSFNQSETRLRTLPRESMYYTSARALELPTSRSFVGRLEEDVRFLLDEFESTTPEKSPLEQFLNIWQAKNWNLITLTWGEDDFTREAFFNTVTQVFLNRIGQDDSTIQSDVGCAFAVYLLYELQPRRISPVPGLKSPANSHHWGTFKVKIPYSTFQLLLDLPNRTSSDASRQDVLFVLNSLLGQDPESRHPGKSAIDVILAPTSRSIVKHEELTLNQKYKQSNGQQFGHLVLSSDESMRLPLTRSEVLLVRAAEALSVDLGALFTERITQAFGEKTEKELEGWKYVPSSVTPQPSTLFEGKWIDRPLRPFDAERLRKFAPVTEQASGDGDDDTMMQDDASP